MEAKEGILLDREDRPILTPHRPAESMGNDWRNHVTRVRLIPGPLGLILVPVTLILVLAFIVIAGAVMLPFWIIRKIFG